MPGANNEHFSKSPPVMTIKGEIAVHFLDDQVIEGKFMTQDLFNIFVEIDGETTMIPRNQIRFIRGKQNQAVEPDTSQDSMAAGAIVPESITESDRSDTKEYPTPSSPAGTDSAPSPAAEDEADGTVVLADDQLPEFEDEDGTVVLPPPSAQIQAGADGNDDDVTFVLPAGIDEVVDVEEDATFVLPAGVDDEDGTVVLIPAAEDESLDAASQIEVEDETVVIQQDESQQLASLVCTAGPHTGQVFKLEGETVTIGRSSDNKIALSSDKEISRHHATIALKSGQYTIKDLDSLNGTFVNSEAVTEPRTLEDNDMVLVGITTLKYQVE